MKKTFNLKAVRSRANLLFVVVLFVSMMAATVLPKSAYASTNIAMVKDIVPDSGESGTNPQNLANVNGTLFFIVDGSDERPPQLWKSDGTEAGTVLLKEGFTATELTGIGNTLYFIANFNGYRELWKSDGTTNGTVRIKEGVEPSSLFAFNGHIHFSVPSGPNAGLWVSDGTDQGTVRITDKMHGGTVVGNTIFSFEISDAEGINLWKSDGTTGGTSLIKYISNANAGYPQYPTDVNGILYFMASDGVIVGNTYRGGLWKSDGTEAGTSMIWEGAAHDITNVNGTVFFSGYPQFDYAGPYRGLWRSDGTASGTTFVKNTSARPNDGQEYIAEVGNLFNVNGILYFTADNGSGLNTTGTELWKSDGTEAGTSMVKDIFPGEESSAPSRFTKFNGELYFSAIDPTTSDEVWKTNGTTAGTTRVSNNFEDNLSQAGSLEEFTVAGDKLFFIGNDGIYGRELWKIEVTADPVDTVAPNVTGAPDRSANSAGWYNNNVGITWTATDPEPSSGAPSQPPAMIAGQEGEHTYTSGQSCDPAGNCATGSIALKIDKTRPTVGGITMSGLLNLPLFGPVLVGNSTTITANATDILSGIVRGEYYIDTDPGQGNGQLMTFTNGKITANANLSHVSHGRQHTLYVRSLDAAGNWSTTTSFSFFHF